MKKLSKLIYYFPLLFILALSGCLDTGGGTDENNENNETNPPEYTEHTLQGTVAIGAPIQNAEVMIRDIQGQTRTTRTNNNGEYSVNTDSMEAPFIIRAEAPNAPIILFSFADEDQTVANATPLTNITLSRALPDGYSLESFFQRFNRELASTVSHALTLIEQDINNTLRTVGYQDFANTNHFSIPFSANQQGYDQFLDDLNPRIEGDSVFILLSSDNDQLLYTSDIEQMLSTDNSPTATISGLILDASNQSPISNASIQATDVYTHETQTGNYNPQTGEFSLNLDRFAVYNLSVSAQGYQPVTYTNLSTFSPISQFSVALIPAISETEVNAVPEFNIHVINATTEDTPVANATIEVREGLNNHYGTPVYTVQTDSTGQALITNISPGNYTFHIQSEGYYDGFQNQAILSTVTSHTFGLRPLQTDQGNGNIESDMSIVLTWGKNPEDLDSHLTGPKLNANTEERFHIAYYNQCWADPAIPEDNCEIDQEGNYPSATAFLDRDDTTSFGPETTTIRHLLNGEYNFYVHHFSGSGTISTSGATVEVIDKYGERHIFHAPIEGSQGTDDVWHVFKTTPDGVIIPINTITQESTDTLRQATPPHQSLFTHLPAKNK